MVRDKGKNRCIPANIRDTAIFSFPNCQRQDYTTHLFNVKYRLTLKLYNYLIYSTKGKQILYLTKNQIGIREFDS